MVRTKEEIKQYQKEYREKNREKQKEYREKNREKQKEYRENYYQHNKSYRISKWKSRGILSDNFDELYEKYINTEYCELCNVNLTEDKRTTKTTRCLDHDHQTGLLRNIVCHCCNIKRG